RGTGFRADGIREYMRLFRRIYTRVKDDSVLAGRKWQEAAGNRRRQIMLRRATSRKKTRTTSILPTFREAGISAATKPQYRGAPTRGHRASAKRCGPHEPTHSVTRAFRSAWALPDATMSKMDAAPGSCCNTAAAR